MNQLYDNIVAFKLVWVRLILYFSIPAATVFLAQTETFSDKTWAEWGTFLKMRLLVSCLVAGGMALAAYIDSSLQRAREHGNELKKERETKQWRKAEIEKQKE